ncbi:MAG: tetratricopeptide repeat protein, partial [Planctomycetes bacterium]|nr:tetratricopeptide repeat protein [Planctomycetota bacterium]
LAQAGEALRAERYREAWERFAAARDDDPEAPEPWLGLARTAALEGRHDLAFTCFRRVLELAPDHRGGGVALIHMLAERGDPAEAAARLEEARGRWGDAPDVEVAAARLELRCGESDDARRRLEEVLARAPEEPDAWILYGEVCLAQGDDSAGLAALRRGKELEPLPLNAANYLAHWFQSGAALDAVCEEVERERGLHPDSVELGKLHAVLCVARRDGQPLRALELLTELCAREPFVLTLHLARADLLGALGVRPELAQEDLDFVLEHDPTLPQALFARCELAQAQEDGPSAWALAKRFAESEPGNPRAWVLRVEAAYRAGELEDFGLAAEAAWTTFPDERGAASIAARYAQSGEPERALEWVRAGRAAYPQSDALSAVEACCRLLASGDPRAEDDARALLGHPWPLLATLSRFSLLSVALQDRARCSPEEVLRWGAELEQVGGRDPCVLTLLARLSSREGYYAHAQRLLGWSLTQQPGNAEALACLAALYATHGGAAEAVGLAQVAVRCARARGQEPLPQAGVLAEQEGWSGGEQLLQGPEALLRLATEAFEAYELPRAHVYARALLAREPRSVEGWLLLGRVAGRRGRLPDAVLALSRVLSLDPRHAEALAHLLQARVKQARYDEAQALARRLRALGASGFSARSAELYLLFSSAGMTAATAQAQALLRDFPEEEDALLTWVLVRGASDPAAARAQLLGYLREHPRSTGWEQLVNSFWPELGDDVRAEAFERLSGLPGLAPSALSDLATRVRALGEPQVGLDLAERGLQLDALGPELWFELGQCRRALGDRAGAREALSTARGLVDVEHRPALDDALRALDAEEGR